jgi:Tfp pilus assembly protein PilF
VVAVVLAVAVVVIAPNADAGSSFTAKTTPANAMLASGGDADDRGAAPAAADGLGPAQGLADAVARRRAAGGDLPGGDAVEQDTRGANNDLPAVATDDPARASAGVSNPVRSAVPRGTFAPASGSRDPGAAAAAQPAPPPRNEPGFQLRLQAPRQSASELFSQGLAAQRSRNFAVAVQLYEEALAADPTNAEAFNNLGTVHQALGHLSPAREAFRRAIAIQPSYAAAWSNLGVVLNALGDEDQAQAALAEAIRLDPGNHGAKVNLALQYQKQDLDTEARRLLEEVVQQAPGMAEAQYALGRLLDGNGDVNGAVRHYQLFLSTEAGRFPQYRGVVAERLAIMTGGGGGR